MLASEREPHSARPASGRGQVQLSLEIIICPAQAPQSCIAQSGPQELVR
jgi:hypothetical protein